VRRATVISLRGFFCANDDIEPSCCCCCFGLQRYDKNTMHTHTDVDPISLAHTHTHNQQVYSINHSSNRQGFRWVDRSIVDSIPRANRSDAPADRVCVEPSGLDTRGHTATKGAGATARAARSKR
jgi:hypothetical protein